MRLSWLVLLCACSSSSGSSVRVDLKTDFIAQAELVSVISTLNGERIDYAIDGSEAFFDGARIAEFDAVPTGTHELVVQLNSAFGSLAQRQFTLAVDADLGLTALITRDCRGVVCDPDSTCAAGNCVLTTCVEAGDPDCPVDECTEPADCPPPVGACASAACVDGACVFSGTCPGDEVCLPERGCSPRAEPLSDRGLMVRYPLSEDVGEVVHSTGETLDLSFEPAMPTAISSIEEPTGSGFQFLGLGGDEGICAPIRGSVIEDFDGTTQGTIETVAYLREGVDNSSRIVSIGISDLWGFSIGFQSDGRRLIFSGNSTAQFYGVWPLPPDDGIPHVYTVVVDSTQPTLETAAQLYIDGRRGPDNMGLSVISGPITIDPDGFLCLGNRQIGGRGLEGQIFYAAYYDTVLNDAEILANAGRLLIDND